MNVSVCVPDSKIKYSSKRALIDGLRAIFSIKAVAVIAACSVVLPLLVIVSSVLQPESEIWQHIVDTLLTVLLKNTFVLCTGVLAGTFLLGVGSLVPPEGGDMRCLSFSRELNQTSGAHGNRTRSTRCCLYVPVRLSNHLPSATESGCIPDPEDWSEERPSPDAALTLCARDRARSRRASSRGSDSYAGRGR